MSIEETKPRKRGKWKVLLTLVIILVLGGLFFKFFMQIRHVKVGYVGVKSDVGNPVDNSADHNMKTVKGYVVFMPLYSEVVVLPTTVHTAEYDVIKVSAKDGAEFVVQPRISYQLDETRAGHFYKNFRQTLPELDKGYLKEVVAYAYMSASGSFGSDSLVNNKNQFEVDAARILTSKLTDIGLVLKNTNANLEIPQKITDIINLRSESLQNAILAEDKVKQAEAEARIVIVQADAIRQEDSLKNSSLTPLSVQKMFIDKWDGKLPVYGETPRIYRDINKESTPKDER